MAHNTFRLEFECSNDAFQADGDHGRAETARVLEAVANEVRQGQLEGLVRDINGNTVGNWSVYYHG